MWAKYNGILYDASIKSEDDVIIRSLKKSETDASFFMKNYMKYMNMEPGMEWNLN